MHTENEYHRGEIFFINEGESSGSEQGGARPGIIVSNDVGNKHAPIVEVVYLTSREKKLMPTHVRIKSSPIPSIALCEQIETVYKKRIGKYLATVRFRNGYTTDAPCFLADCKLTVGEGKPEWGAVPGTEYYILKMKNVRRKE